jgi:hypothetical protein
MKKLVNMGKENGVLVILGLQPAAECSDDQKPLQEVCTALYSSVLSCSHIVA